MQGLYPHSQVKSSVIVLLTNFIVFLITED